MGKNEKGECMSDGKSIEQLAAEALGKVTDTVEPKSTTPDPVIAFAEKKAEDVKTADVKIEEKIEEKKEEIKAEEKKDEVKKEDEKKEEPKDDKTSSRFAALTRKEKALRMREKELESKSAKYKDLDDLVSLAKENPIEALAKIGLDYEQLTAFLLKGDKPEIKKLSKLENELEQLKKEKRLAEEEAKKIKVETKVSEFKSTIQSSLSTNSDKFELLNQNPNAVEAVYAYIESDFDEKYAAAEENGDPLPTREDMIPVEEAAQIIEDYLFTEINRYTKTKKFAPKEQPKEPVKVPESKKESVEEKKETSPSTLSNTMVNQTPPSKTPMTREQEIDLAAKTFKLFE
jgi:hypothetical protein